MDCDMIRVRVLAALVGLACLGMGPGCGRNAYRLADVSGRVTLDGEPLAGGVVSFQPQAAGGSVAGPGSTGRIDADGRYRLASIDGGSGAVVGTHLVRIYSRSPESASKSDSDGPGTRERMPSRYNYESGLTYTVAPAGSTTADFELEGDAGRDSR